MNRIIQYQLIAVWLNYKGNKEMRKEILCTLGPASMNTKVIRRLEELGIGLFRINLSHVALEDVGSMIEFIQSRTSVPVCLDTEGAQVRTVKLTQGSIDVSQNQIISVSSQKINTNEFDLNLYPDNAIEFISQGDLISIDFNSALVQVIAKSPEALQVRVLNGGKIGSNKAVTVMREINLPVLTAKDEAAIKIGMKMGVKHVALSFANRGDDVDYIRQLCTPETFIISKVECRNALMHLSDICSKSDAVLIDRGDLSREESIERIPKLQKMIIKEAKSKDKKVYVATNLLESMIVSPQPTRAEVNDVINTLNDGADGLVLAAETAIGIDPISCVHMIVKLIAEFEEGVDLATPYYPRDAESLLIDPVGGKLVHRQVNAELDYSDFKSLSVNDEVLFDCEQIALGAYSPLTGFMNQTQVSDCLESGLKNAAHYWPKPIQLVIDPGLATSININQKIVLRDQRNVAVAQMLVLNKEASNLGQQPSKIILSGSIELIQSKHTEFRQFQLHPKQSRYLFTHKNWTHVIGVIAETIDQDYQQMQVVALKHNLADGIFVGINPISCPHEPFAQNTVFKHYQESLLKDIYPSDSVIIGATPIAADLSTREGILHTALVLQNLGCSHFLLPQSANSLKVELVQSTARNKYIGIKLLFSSDLSMSDKLEVSDVWSGGQI
jgi:pyruvate kinase